MQIVPSASGLGLVGWLKFWEFNYAPNSAWALGHLANLTGQLGKIAEHPRPKSGAGGDETPCKYKIVTPKLAIFEGKK